MARQAWKVALGLQLTLGASAQSGTQQFEVPDWENSVRFELLASQQPARPGDDLELAVVAQIEPGYHLYGPEERKPNRTEVHVSGSEFFRMQDPSFPPVITRELLGLGKYDLYEGKIAIRIPISMTSAGMERKSIPVEVKVNYQVCTDVACSPPASTILSLSLPVAPPGAPVQRQHEHIFSTRTK